MARYLERAENLARILDINETYARDNPEGPDWKRVLDLYSDAKRFSEENEQADAKSVLTFYITDRNNPTSVASSIRAARENARAVRHLISTEMWTHLNTLHGDISAIKTRDIRSDTLARTAHFISRGCQTFEGIAEGTFFRGEAWNYYHLGKYLERADQTTRILDMGYQRLSPSGGDTVAWVHWNVLLRSVSGYHAFCSKHPASNSPRDIATFLLNDDEFPRAVSLCIARISDRLKDIDTRHHKRRPPAVEAARVALETLVDDGIEQKLTSTRLHAHLDKIQIGLGGLADAITDVYFAPPDAN